MNVIACLEINGCEWYYKSNGKWTTTLEEATVVDDHMRLPSVFYKLRTVELRTVDEILHDKRLGKNKFNLNKLR